MTYFKKVTSITVFLNLFWFAVPFLGFSTFWRHPEQQFNSKYQSNLEIGGTPTAFWGTLGFRDTPVENHCSRHSALSTLWLIRLFILNRKIWTVICPLSVHEFLFFTLSLGFYCYFFKLSNTNKMPKKQIVYNNIYSVTWTLFLFWLRNNDFVKMQI